MNEQLFATSFMNDGASSIAQLSQQNNMGYLMSSFDSTNSLNSMFPSSPTNSSSSDSSFGVNGSTSPVILTPEWDIANRMKMQYLQQQLMRHRDQYIRSMAEYSKLLVQQCIGAPSLPAIKLSPVRSNSVGKKLSASEKKKIREYARNLTCFNCQTNKTPLWRRTADKKHSLCNACGLYYKQYNSHRPVEYKDRNPRAPKRSMAIECQADALSI
jgi:hypothetical protein